MADYDQIVRDISPPRPSSGIALTAGFLLLIAAVLSSVWFTFRQQAAFEQVRHTLTVENHLSQVLSRVEQAEASGRGFMLTGRSDFLQPVEDARRVLPGEMRQLHEFVVDNPDQRARVPRLVALARQRLDHIAVSVNGYWRGVTLPTDHYVRGQAIMNEFRDLVGEMKAEEAQLLAVRSAEAGRQARLAATAVTVTGILIILLFLAAIRDNRRRLHEALTARDALSQANQRLTEEAHNRETAEATLRQMQKVEAIGQLTGGIAHDFNNMLAVVIGSLDMAQRRLDKGEVPRATRLVDNAMEGAQRAARLTARLLAFSRQQPLDPQAVDANKLVGDMSEILRRTIGDDIRMETVLAGGLWRTFADAGQLENAILNLCINGRDAMPTGGKLTVETANCHLDDAYAAAHPAVAAGQYVLISVTDTGTGMDQAVADRAFDPFFTTKGAGQGTGLGLSQVHGFIRQSGGHIKIYSEPGHGTTVKLYLPRHHGPASADEEGEADETTELPRARGEVILVVEDDDRVRHVSADALRDLGYTVMQAPDAHQALTMLGMNARVDLLFTDVVMPDVNGRELADRARAARPDLKVLFTTGYTRNAIVHNGTLDPGVELLPKPFTVEQLARKVRQVLDREA